MAKTETRNVITPRMRISFGPLADNLMCAYLSHQSGSAFATIKARYGSEATGQPPGDYWIFAAGRMIGEMMERSGSPANQELEKIAVEQRGRMLKHTRPRKKI